MLDFKSRILIISAAAAFTLSMILKPTFAASTIQIENNSNGNFLNFGENFPFGDSFPSFFNDFFSQTYDVSLDGAQEIPGPGDVDGKGDANLRLKPEKNQICVDMEVSYLDKPTAAHIHNAPVGSSGAVVVTLPTPNQDGETSGCVDVERQLIDKIKANPQEYYLNVHTETYPEGAIRGQLTD